MLLHDLEEHAALQVINRVDFRPIRLATEQSLAESGTEEEDIGPVEGDIVHIAHLAGFLGRVKGSLSHSATRASGGSS